MMIMTFFCTIYITSTLNGEGRGWGSVGVGHLEYIFKKTHLGCIYGHEDRAALVVELVGDLLLHGHWIHLVLGLMLLKIEKIKAYKKVG